MAKSFPLASWVTSILMLLVFLLIKYVTKNEYPNKIEYPNHN